MQKSRYNKHIKALRWDSNTWALSLRSDFSPRVTAPYVGVMCQMKTETDFTIAALRLEEKYTRVNNSGLLEAFGFVQSNALTMDELELELALSEYILSNLNDSSRDLGPAVFALGKTHQDKYLDLFKNVMAERLDFDLNSAYQAGIAIENLGVRILYSASPLENPEQTRQRIREYLDSAGT